MYITALLIAVIFTEIVLITLIDILFYFYSIVVIGTAIVLIMLIELYFIFYSIAVIYTAITPFNV